MRGIIRLSIFIILFTIAYWIIFRLDSFVILPIATFVICCILIAEYYYDKSKIRSGKILALGKDKSSRFKKISGTILGIALIIWGYFKSGDFSYFGFDSIAYFGLFVIVLALFGDYDYYIIFKEKYFKQPYFGLLSEYKYSKVKSLTIFDDSFELFAKSDRIKYTFESDDERQKLIDFMKLYLDDRMTIN